MTATQSPYYFTDATLSTAGQRPDGTATFGTGNSASHYAILKDPNAGVELGLNEHVRTVGTEATVTGVTNTSHGGQTTLQINETLAASGAQSATRALLSSDYSITGTDGSADWFANHDVVFTFHQVSRATKDGHITPDQTFTLKEVDGNLAFVNAAGVPSLGLGDHGLEGSNPNHVGDSYNTGFEGFNDLSPGVYDITMQAGTEIGTTGHYQASHFSLAVELTLT